MQAALPEPVRRTVEETVQNKAHELEILDVETVTLDIARRFPPDTVPVADIRESVIAAAGKRGIAVELG